MQVSPFQIARDPDGGRISDLLYLTTEPHDSCYELWKYRDLVPHIRFEGSSTIPRISAGQLRYE